MTVDNYTSIWTSVLKSLSKQVKKTDFLVWFQDTNILDLNNESVVVGVPSIFAKDWFEKKYRSIIESELKNEGYDKSLTFQIDTSLKAEAKGVDVKNFLDSSKRRSRKINNRNEVSYKFDSGKSTEANTIVSKMLNPKYQLSNFVVGSSSRLAFAACQAVAQKPGNAYNPLFIYGDVGLGKTHLLQATGNSVLKNFDDAVVVYLTAEKFTNEIVEAIKKNNVRGFRAKYRKVDCLVIDDIQFLAGKGRTQEEFFHTFNELYHENKQIIISSDKPPQDLEGVEDRLVSRFEMGMIVDVTFPDYETCLAILMAKSQELQFMISSEVLEFIALNINSSIRELEGILTQIIAQSRLEGAPPSIESVSRTLKKLGKLLPNHSSHSGGYNDNPDMNSSNSNNNSVLMPSTVIEKVASFFNLTKFDLIGTRRTRDIMIPRQICIYILRNHFNLSFEKIGSEFGGRNHTTIMHACQKMEKGLKNDSKLNNLINSVRQNLNL